MSPKSITAAAALALLWIGEALIPLVEDRQRRVSHGGANVFLGVANGALASVVFASGILFVTEWARTEGFGLLHWAGLTGVVAAVAAVLLIDFWQYLWHRINHVVPVLWRFHSVHHTDEEMDATSGVRFHTGEILFSGVARLAVMPVLGVTIEELLLYEAIVLPVVLFHHSNVRVPGGLDRLLRALIVTPWMHWVHHSKWQPETDSNFSSLFSWWDRLFGTLRLRDDPRTIDLGLEGYEEHEWRSVVGMLKSPFRRRRPHDSDHPRG
jgi:sterol desaturase/sphingolipid hydroxylase (fatty acid hydroxylase superfamily)